MARTLCPLQQSLRFVVLHQCGLSTLDLDLTGPSCLKIVVEHESAPWVLVLIWTLNTSGLLLHMLKGIIWTLSFICILWIVIVHARRHQGPAWHSRHLSSTLSAPGQSWAPEFYGASS